VNTNFCFKMGKTTTEIFQLMKQAYGCRFLSRIRVFEGCVRFRDGHDNLEDYEGSGRPTAIRIPDTIETVLELI
jgi:hypothetical protein